MRTANIVILIGLVAAGLWGQAKDTFKTQISMGMGSFEGSLTASERGYSWTGTDGHYHSNGLIPWKDVRKWSCTGEVSGFALDVHHQTGADTFRFRHDDLVTLVDKYFKKYAGDKLDGAVTQISETGGYQPTARGTKRVQCRRCEKDSI